jgi:hypothetical protein
MTRQRPFFFDQIVESTRIIFGSRLGPGGALIVEDGDVSILLFQDNHEVSGGHCSLIVNAQV